jgi:hypothetical protein
MVTREEMMARKDEWLARKDELQGKFVDTATDPMVDSALGLSLVGAGLGTIVVNAVRRNRSVWGYVIGMLFVLAGVAVLGGTLKVRSGRISEAEEQVRAQLASLDPIARAQVLKDMAGETVAPFVRRGQVAAAE